MSPDSVSQPPCRVVELFAGVGGFRVGLRTSGWQVVWANQWEPGARVQHAFDCYVGHFRRGEHVCEDIEVVLDQVEAGEREIPDHELLVGGFPCQDYSVARALNQAHGLEGKKGVLWWQIHRLLRLKRPPFFFLENVDRLLKSPASQRGRDFAVMLATLAELGYEVEWRMVNAADYGFPQKRRRTYIVGRLAASPSRDPVEVLYHGTLGRALPIAPGALEAGRASGAPGVDPAAEPSLTIDTDAVAVSEGFSAGGRPFRNAGYMSHGSVWTIDAVPAWDGPRRTLGDILEPLSSVPPSAFVPDAQLATWQYLKGSKRERRTHKDSGTDYFYVEGRIPFPDPTDRPARTILTGEGGPTPSRFKHLVRVDDGRYRRLTPRELERLNGFPDDWTKTGMPEGRRAFMMGNSVIVGIIERIGRELMADLRTR